MMRAALCTVTSRWASLGVFALMMAAANSAGATSLPQDTVITAPVGCHSSASDASATIRMWIGVQKGPISGVIGVQKGPLISMV